MVHHYGKRMVSKSIYRLPKAPSSSNSRFSYDVSSSSSTTQKLSPIKIAQQENKSVASLMAKLQPIYTGGKKNVELKTFNGDGTPYTELVQKEVKRGPLALNEDWYAVNLPKWKSFADARAKEAEELGQTPNEEMIYRLYKGSTIHEDSHVRFSPPEFLKGNKEDRDWNTQTKRTLFNIIDDRRIEEMQSNKLPGFVPLRLLRQGYWGSRRPNVEELAKRYDSDENLWKDPNNEKYASYYAREKFNTSAPTEEQIREAFEEHKEAFRAQRRKEAIVEAFTQSLLMGKQKGELPKEDQEKLDQIIEEIKNELRTDLEDEKKSSREIYNGLKKLVEKFMQEMNIPDDDKDETRSEMTDPHEGEGNFDPKEIENFLNNLVPDKEGPREDGDPGTMITREDIEKALNGTPQDAKELQQIMNPQGKNKDEDPSVPEEFEPLTNTGDPSIYRDKKFITKMNELLSQWRAGWKRVFGSSGTMYNLQRELGTRGEEAFTSRLRLDAGKTKTLFVIDMSGSMYPRQEDYKRVLASTMEVLEGIRAQTAIFGFSEASADFFKLKDFRQPWNRQRQEELAGMQAQGGTPLAATLIALEPYIKKHRPQYTVIITDGSPEDDPREIIKTLRKETHLVGFGIGDEDIAKKLKSFGVNESFSVNDPYAIPAKLVPKIAPVS
jgi:hypothetical protein